VSLRQLGHDNPETLRIRQTLTRILLQMDRTDEAEREIDTALSSSPVAPDSPLTRHTRCLILVTRGRIAEAAEELASLLEDQIRSQGPGHPETEGTRENAATRRGDPVHLTRTDCPSIHGLETGSGPHR
jgi:hypothetical protein